MSVYMELQNKHQGLKAGPFNADFMGLIFLRPIHLITLCASKTKTVPIKAFSAFLIL